MGGQAFIGDFPLAQCVSDVRLLGLARVMNGYRLLFIKEHLRIRLFLSILLALGKYLWSSLILQGNLGELNTPLHDQPW